MSHELGTEARVTRDLLAEITKKEKKDYDSSNETVFYQENPHLLPNCRFGCSQTTDNGETSELQNLVRELRRDIPISTFS